MSNRFIVFFLTSFSLLGCSIGVKSESGDMTLSDLERAFIALQSDSKYSPDWPVYSIECNEKMVCYFTFGDYDARTITVHLEKKDGNWEVIDQVLSIE